MTSSARVDRAELETKVQDMYRAVALHPEGEFHFEMGRALAERLGYAPVDLDRIPAEAIESFAGVGYYFHLADLKEGDVLLKLNGKKIVDRDDFLARVWQRKPGDKLKLLVLRGDHDDALGHLGPIDELLDGP